MRAEQKPVLVAEEGRRRLKQNTKNTKKHLYSELRRCLPKLYRSQAPDQRLVMWLDPPLQVVYPVVLVL